MKTNGGSEMTTRAVPREITKAVLNLATVCSKHDFQLPIEDGMLDLIIKQEEKIELQKAYIAELEKRLGIDPDEL